MEPSRQMQLQKEDKLNQMLANLLELDGNIDFIFIHKDQHGEMNLLGTILHFSIIEGYEKVVEFALNRGANILIKMTSIHEQVRNCNALDLAAKKYNYHNPEPRRVSIFKTLKKRSLELYSSYGLTSFHVDCAVPMRHWSDECVQYLQIAPVNGAISTESPLWPGETPLMVAAKFSNFDLLTNLLDRGADPLARDPEDNTPLHYLHNDWNLDKRLFALDGRNTFGSISGESHFHIACRDAFYNMDIVRRYLDQGISPDLPIQKSGNKYNPCLGMGGLHIAVATGIFELIQLLLEQGADMNKKDSSGRTPVECIGTFYDDEIRNMYCLCLLIEAGSNQERININELWEFIADDNYHLSKGIFLSCIVKLKLLSKNLVSKNLMDVYVELSSKRVKDWNEAEYLGRCSNELKTLHGLGLRHVLDNTIIFKRNFKDNFGWLGSFDFDSYPIYENLLKIRFKQNLQECENKKRKISQVVPRLQWLFQSLCQLPYLCAELILWNLSDKELDSFVKQLSNEAERCIISFLRHQMYTTNSIV